MKKYLIAVALIVGCTNEPTARYETTNTSVPVSLLFEHDGCKVYRFLDGIPHYYAVCRQGQEGGAFDEHVEGCGKNCSQTVQRDVPTIRVHLNKP